MGTIRSWLVDLRIHRASWWLLIAAVGALLIWFSFGGVQYLGSWAGSLAKAASGAWGGYWVSRNVLKADPSARSTESERNTDKLVRAIIVAAFVIGVCLAV